jgi:hypothetical protein
MFVKIIMLPSVNVIYLRIDNNLIPIFIINIRRARMYWEGSGKVSKLKNNFLQQSLFLQPIMILIIFFCNQKIFILSEKYPQTIHSDTFRI